MATKPFYRKITLLDLDELFTVRTSVRENVLTINELAKLGITPESTAGSLGRSLDGFLCELSGRVVGFSIADVKAGELSVIAVLPEYEGRGIGRELLRLSEDLAWAAGHESIWLWTGVDRSTRALRLYRNAEWIETGVSGDRLYMKKFRPA